MNIEESTGYFKENLALQIHKVITPELCHNLISKYERYDDSDRSNVISDEIIKECADSVFVDNVHALLEAVFQGGYQVRWSRVDVVDSCATLYEYNTRWHLDGGIPKTLKLFVYLNSVSEHGGNTLIIDRERTKKLKESGVLPRNDDERTEDLTPALERLGLDSSYSAYDLKAGDALLFSPLLLAHRCLPPQVSQKRFTVCFTITPAV